MKNSNLKIEIFVFLGILILGLPLFFDVYRITAFHAVSHDDYIPFFRYCLGEEGGGVPDSPTGYRFFSIWVAVPFYYLLPLVRFTYLEGVSEMDLRILQALSMTTYLADSVTSLIIYKCTRKLFGGNNFTALLAAITALLLFRFTAVYGIDATAIMLIGLIGYYLDRVWIFAILLLLSVGFNEKIVFLFFMLFSARLLNSISKNYLYFGISLSAFMLYFLVRLMVDLPGHEYMLEPGMFLQKGIHTFRLLFTTKSIYLNWLPSLITFALFILALKESKFRFSKPSIYFSSIDVLPVFGFLAIATITDMQYTIGRILLFCFPLFLPLAILYIERYFRALNSRK